MAASLCQRGDRDLPGRPRGWVGSQAARRDHADRLVTMTAEGHRHCARPDAAPSTRARRPARVRHPGGVTAIEVLDTPTIDRRPGSRGASPHHPLCAPRRRTALAWLSRAGESAHRYRGHAAATVGVGTLPDWSPPLRTRELPASPTRSTDVSSWIAHRPSSPPPRGERAAEDRCPAGCAARPATATPGLPPPPRRAQPAGPHRIGDGSPITVRNVTAFGSRWKPTTITSGPTFPRRSRQQLLLARERIATLHTVTIAARISTATSLPRDRAA